MEKQIKGVMETALAGVAQLVEVLFCIMAVRVLSLLPTPFSSSSGLLW